jgi:hypothetical protein
LEENATKSSPITSIFVSVAAALILPTTVNRARGADKVLVGGKPPLTQGMIDLGTAAVELLLEQSRMDRPKRLSKQRAVLLS